MLLYGIKNVDIYAVAVSFSLILLIYYDYHQAVLASDLVEGLSISRDAPKIVTELEEFEVHVIAENLSGTDIPYITIRDSVPEYVEVQRKPTASMILPRGEAVGFSYKIRPVLSGSHTLYGLTVRVGGPLGFFVVETELRSPTSFTVLPYSGGVPLRLKSLERLWGLIVPGRSTGGMYDIADLREYSPGDDYRKIVWKALARSGKLYVREDFGEVTMRLLLMLDVNAINWELGTPPNTLASIELRVLRSIVETLAKYGVSVDVAVCCSATTKVVRNATEDVERSLVDIFSYITPYCSCSSPITVFLEAPTYLGRSVEDYSAMLLVVNPVAVASENPARFLELVRTFGRKFKVVIPRFEYENYIDKEDLAKFYSTLASLVERAEGSVEMLEENLTLRPIKRG